MTSTKMFINEILESRLRDREAMRKAAHRMDELRRRCGKAEKDFNSVAVLRKIREAR